MTRLDAAEELADAVQVMLETSRHSPYVLIAIESLKESLETFRKAKDWMLLEGETTRVQCLICLCDCELFEDSCPHCCNEFTGLDEFREHAPFIDEFNEDLV